MLPTTGILAFSRLSAEAVAKSVALEPGMRVARAAACSSNCGSAGFDNLLFAVKEQ
jgi:hypothetical protein